MNNIKPEVLNTLEDDPALVTLLGGKRIYFQAVPDPDEYPRITFYELDNRGSLFADNREQASDIYIVIDIWSKGSTTAAAQRVDEVMKGMGFSRELSTDLYEDDVKVFHKHMRFSISREV